MKNSIKFISYDGKWPNLCHGKLIFEKDGKRFEWENALSTGGSVSHDGTYQNWDIEKGRWSIHTDYVPEDELNDFTRGDILELEEAVNNEVDQGCCGGCI